MADKFGWDNNFGNNPAPTRSGLQQNLLRARLDLLNAQTNLALVRKHKNAPWLAHKAAEGLFCRALDRVWEAQCMAEGSFHA